MRRPSAGRKRDANEASIVAALRAAGATVEQLSGPDIPDLLVGYGKDNYLAEVKADDGKLEPGQVQWIIGWRGNRVWVLRTPEDGLQMLGLKVRSNG